MSAVGIKPGALDGAQGFPKGATASWVRPIVREAGVP